MKPGDDVGTDEGAEDEEEESDGGTEESDEHGAENVGVVGASSLCSRTSLSPPSSGSVRDLLGCRLPPGGVSDVPGAAAATSFPFLPLARGLGDMSRSPSSSLCS